MPGDVITVEDPRSAGIRELLGRHLAFTVSASPFMTLSPVGSGAAACAAALSGSGV